MCKETRFPDCEGKCCKEARFLTVRVSVVRRLGFMALRASVLTVETRFPEEAVRINFSSSACTYAGWCLLGGSPLFHECL